MKKEHPHVKVGVNFERQVKIPKIIDDDWAEPAEVKMHIGNGTIVNAGYHDLTFIHSDDESDDHDADLSESARINDIDALVESMVRAKLEDVFSKYDVVPKKGGLKKLGR